MKGIRMKNIIKLGIITTIFILNYNFSFTQFQSDESDAVWSIVAPYATAQNIDMEKVIVSNSKDSVVSDFIQNPGKYPCRIDSIYIQGADASAFSLVGGFPVYTIEPSDSYFGEFRFIPNRVGIHRAEIVIVTQAETIVQNIIGEGVEPKLEIVNSIMDFGTIQVGDFIDSLQAVTVKNIGNAPLEILDTKHNYPNVVDFSTLSGGGNFILQPGQEAIMDLRFTANSPGRTSGTLEFHYDGVGSPAVVQLFGEGIIETRLEIVNSIIDFGTIKVGDFIDSLQAVTVQNIGNAPLEILDTKHNYPNVVDFSTLSGGGNFILQPGQEAMMDLRFTANSPGRTSGTLEFHYDGVGSPAVVQLFGEGKFMGVASAQLKTIEIEAYAGDLINIPIILDYEVDLSLSSVNTIDVEMTFNPTLLYPQNLNMEIINENLAKVLIKDLPANKSAGEILGEVAFIVGLGNAETCDITLVNPIANGGDADITLQSGHFRLLGVCYEGGTRLLNPYSKAGILSIAPNPADDNLEIAVSLIESGMTELVIYNTMGEKVLTVFSTASPLNGIQNHYIDTKLLSTGQYYLQLRTPTHIENQIIKIVK